MSFLNSLNITGSALTAERFRTDVILQNLANMNNTMTASGEPYRRRQVIFEERGLNFDRMLQDQQAAINGSTTGTGGVRVKEIVENQSPFKPVYDPSHPHADENGYVLHPNVSHTEEQIDLMAATRAYEANLTALNVVKSMAMRALDIGRN